MDTIYRGDLTTPAGRRNAWIDALFIDHAVFRLAWTNFAAVAPEVKLAREAEICYATVAMVTDYDCWHDEHEAVTVEHVVKVLLGNADRARALVRAVVPSLGAEHQHCHVGCDHALDHAIITAPSERDPALLSRLDAIGGRVLFD